MEVPHPILQSAKRLERSETVERLERLERADPHDERSEAIERLERFERIVSPYTITLTALSPGTSTAFILYPFAFIPYPLNIPVVIFAPNPLHYEKFWPGSDAVRLLNKSGVERLEHGAAVERLERLERAAVLISG